VGAGRQEVVEQVEISRDWHGRFKGGIVPWNKGKPYPAEFKERMSIIQKRNLKLFNHPNIKKSQFKKGSIPWNKNKKMDKVYKEKISRYTKKAMQNQEIMSKIKKTQFKIGHTPWNKGKEHPFVKGDKNPMKRPEIIKKVSEINKIVIKNLYKEHPEIVQKIKEQTKKAMQRPDIKQKIQKTWYKKGNIPWTKGKPRPIKTIGKIRNTLREFYRNNPEHLKKILTFRRPNKTEEKLTSLFQANFPQEFKFVGDGSLILEGLNPDWVNCNGKKLIIELFGEHWHTKEEEKERISKFAKYGFKTLILWWKDTRDEKLVIEKVRNFIDNID